LIQGFANGAISSNCSWMKPAPPRSPCWSASALSGYPVRPSRPRAWRIH